MCICVSNSNNSSLAPSAAIRTFKSVESVESVFKLVNITPFHCSSFSAICSSLGVTHSLTRSLCVPTFLCMPCSFCLLSLSLGANTLRHILIFHITHKLMRARKWRNNTENRGERKKRTHTTPDPIRNTKNEAIIFARTFVCC